MSCELTSGNCGHPLSPGLGLPHLDLQHCCASVRVRVRVRLQGRCSVQQGRLLAALHCIVRKSHRGSGASERVSEWGSGGRGLCLPRGLQGEARVAVREDSGAVRIDDCARSLHLPSTHTHTHTHSMKLEVLVASLRHCVTASLPHSLTHSPAAW